MTGNRAAAKVDGVNAPVSVQGDGASHAALRELVVVGAGPAGLATAGVARRLGFEPLVIDRADAVGGAWAKMRPMMRCLSPRRYDRMPDGSTPEGPGERASAAEVLAWLRRFAALELFDMRLNTAVEAATATAAGWHLETSSGAIQTRRLVVATGEYGRPRTPQIPGTFSGPSDHSSTARIDSFDPASHVLVVGAGNSAAEIVSLLLDRGCKVTVAARSGLDEPAGVATGWLAEVRWQISGLPIHSGPLGWLPVAVLGGPGGCVASTPVVDSVLHDAAKSGRIRVVGAAMDLKEHAVRCEGAGEVSCDRIVWATGFVRETSWLPATVSIDGDGVARQLEGVSQQVKGLGFVGIPCQRTRRSGFMRGFVDDARIVLERLA